MANYLSNNFGKPLDFYIVHHVTLAVCGHLIIVLYLLYTRTDLLGLGDGNSGPALSVLKYDYVHGLLHQHFDFFHHFIAIVAYAYRHHHVFAVQVNLYYRNLHAY